MADRRKRLIFTFNLVRQLNYIATEFAGKHYTCHKTCNSNGPGLSSLQWDSAELFQIGVQDQMSYDDAFTIEEVRSVTF